MPTINGFTTKDKNPEEIAKEIEDAGAEPKTNFAAPSVKSSKNPLNKNKKAKFADGSDYVHEQL